MQKLSCIGLTADYSTMHDKRGSLASQYISPENYTQAIYEQHAMALILPHQPMQHVAALISMLDGLLITGGNMDIPPDLYGEEPHSTLGNIIQERSYFEKALLEEALQRNMPVLGICGGMQLLNIVCGGSLYQDLSLRPGTSVHEQPHAKSLPQHTVNFVKTSHLAAIYQTHTLQTNSTHHQMIKQLGHGLVASAHATDGVIEAIEADDHRFVLGVQWHPEEMANKQHRHIYQAFVQAANRYHSASYSLG